MRDAKKNRDPERAKLRAVTDARCALRKLGLLEALERAAEDIRRGREAAAEQFVSDLVRALKGGA